MVGLSNIIICNSVGEIEDALPFGCDVSDHRDIGAATRLSRLSVPLSLCYLYKDGDSVVSRLRNHNLADRMGPGGCFRSILHLNKAKGGKVNGSSGRRNGGDKHFLRTSGGKRIEDVAATRIQTAVRAFLARKTLRRLKCAEKFQGLSRGPFVREQVTSTLCYLHEWSRIQSEITTRRIRMVTEARLKQKKLENQLKFEAKLHKLEVEWCGGPGTLDEILAKLYEREEAASKRERALAYAFAHQWRADSGHYVGQTSYYLHKDLGWSWMERWLAVRPWKIRIQPDRKGLQTKQQNKPAKPYDNMIPNRSWEVTFCGACLNIRNASWLSFVRFCNHYPSFRLALSD